MWFRNKILRAGLKLYNFNIFVLKMVLESLLPSLRYTVTLNYLINGFKLAVIK